MNSLWTNVDLQNYCELLSTIPAYLILHVRCPLILSDFKQICNSRTFFVKLHCIRFYEKPFVGSRIDPCRRQTDRHDENNSRFSRSMQTLLSIRFFHCFYHINKMILSLRKLIQLQSLQLRMLREDCY